MPSKRDNLYAGNAAFKPVGFEGSVSDREYNKLFAANATGDATPSVNDMYVASGGNKNTLQ